MQAPPEVQLQSLPVCRQPCNHRKHILTCFPELIFLHTDSVRYVISTAMLKNTVPQSLYRMYTQSLQPCVPRHFTAKPAQVYWLQT